MNSEQLNNINIDELLSAMSEPQPVEEHAEQEEMPIENTVFDEAIENITPELTIGNNTTRFNSASWIEIGELPATVIGVGGIGSWLTFLLSRMNVSTYLYDADTVDATNMGGQLYSYDNIGNGKCSSISQFCRKMSNTWNVNYHSSNYVTGNNLLDIVFCCVDNMSTRKTVFDDWCRHVSRVQSEPDMLATQGLFVDGRLSAECFQIFCIDKNDEYAIKEYREKYLFDDSEADETVCSYKQTSFTAAMIGAFMTNLFINWFVNTKNNMELRPVPFKTEYDASLFYLKTSD